MRILSCIKRLYAIYLQGLVGYVTRKHTWRPRTLMKADKIAVSKQMQQSYLSIREETFRSKVLACPVIVPRHVIMEKRYVHIKKWRILYHPPDQVAARQSWDIDHNPRKHVWNKIIFLDENRFNLDGLHGCKYYLHDLRGRPQTLFCRHWGAGVWTYRVLPLLKVRLIFVSLTKQWTTRNT